ncbi:MAG: cytochrome c family protein, partial [Deltaproteobacteria bacterium]|nr:cytochrome c family protein [Kofleriaceae bacterium]
MRRSFIFSLCLSLCLSIPAALAARRDFVGSATCGGCHPQILAAWQSTAHARAAASLGPRPAARCLACHGTGDAPAGRAYFAEVGCEACHG